MVQTLFGDDAMEAIPSQHWGRLPRVGRPSFNSVEETTAPAPGIWSARLFGSQCGPGVEAKLENRQEDPDESQEPFLDHGCMPFFAFCWSVSAMSSGC